jgi:thiosulfate dehydrogenase (quinone) large subunit
MTNSAMDRRVTLFFRLALGWVFLYAGTWQVLSPSFSVAEFLEHTKTFHGLFAVFTTPAVAPFMTFLVKWGHLLIGLSLVSGLLVRVSGPCGMALLGVYYLAHLDFPYVETHVNLILDYHIVYIALIGYLVAARAGHVWGLDGWVERQGFFRHHPFLRPLVG